MDLLAIAALRLVCVFEAEDKVGAGTLFTCPEDLIDEGGLGMAKGRSCFVSLGPRGGALGLRMED